MQSVMRWALPFLFAAAVVGTGSTLAQTPPQDAIVGVWTTEDGDSKIDIARTAMTYGGKVSWLKEPERDGKPAHDAKNANPALRERPIMGLEILSGFTYANGTWSGGTIYSPKTGKSYTAELSLTKDNRLDVKVKDNIFSKHVYWTR